MRFGKIVQTASRRPPARSPQRMKRALRARPPAPPQVAVLCSKLDSAYAELASGQRVTRCDELLRARPPLPAAPVLPRTRFPKL